MRRPERRSKKIGTKSQGFKHRNQMGIPSPHLLEDSRVHWERLVDPLKTEETIGETNIVFFYERPAKDFTYGGSIANVVQILKAVEPHVSWLPRMIVFHQPTKKVAKLEPTWGRYVYWADIDKVDGEAIYLCANEIGRKFSWSRSLAPAQKQELERLRLDGHVFEEDRRSYTITTTESSIRNTVLYRTLLHELGHLNHYNQEVYENGKMIADDSDTAYDLFFRKPSSEREAFAHRFAAEMRAKLKLDGVIPF